MRKLLIPSLVLLSLLTPVAVDAATATYYGNAFVGRKMANGRRYNHGLMVAAHPTLRLGTRIRVTNRRNGRSVVVRVTDRCRCSLDLSKAAFRRLAPLSKGRIPVKIKRI